MSQIRLSASCRRWNHKTCKYNKRTHMAIAIEAEMSECPLLDCVICTCNCMCHVEKKH